MIVNVDVNDSVLVTVKDCVGRVVTLVEVVVNVVDVNDEVLVDTSDVSVTVNVLMVTTLIGPGAAFMQARRPVVTVAQSDVIKFQLTFIPTTLGFKYMQDVPVNE